MKQQSTSTVGNVTFLPSECFSSQLPRHNIGYRVSLKGYGSSTVPSSASRLQELLEGPGSRGVGGEELLFSGSNECVVKQAVMIPNH